MQIVTRHIEIQLPVTPLEVAQMVFSMEEPDQEVFFNEISKQSSSFQHAFNFQLEGLPDHMYLTTEQVAILIGCSRDTVISRTELNKKERYYLESHRATPKAPLRIKVKWLKEFTKRAKRGYLPNNEQ